MSASRNDIKKWLDEGKEKGATHVLIALDTWDYENYPVYIMPNENAREKVNEYGKSQDRIDEVYNLSMNIEEQLNAVRVMNY